MSDQQSSPQEGPGSRRKPWTYGHPWTYHPGYWGPTETWKEPYYEPYGPQWGPPPRGPPPNYNYYYQGNQAQSASHGKPQTHIASKSSAQSGPKKRKVAEVALVSQPKAGSAKTSSRPIKSGKQNPPPQAVQLQAAKRMESFAKLNRKAQLYQAAMERFRRSLVYHNRRFSENIQETDLVNLDDQSEEVELSVALKRKQRNRERLNKRKAKSLAEKGSKPAEEPEATLDQTAARNSQSSTVVVSTPVSLDTDVEMTPVVALPEGELKEGQIYHLEPRAEAHSLRFHLTITDRNEQWTFGIRNGVLQTHIGHRDNADATINATFEAFAQFASKAETLSEFSDEPGTSIEGDNSKLELFLSLLDYFTFGFEIVLP